MAVTHEIVVGELVELTEPVEGAPAGARGGVTDVLGPDRADLAGLGDRDLAESRWASRPIERMLFSFSGSTEGAQRANDNYGFVPSARPGWSQGRPATNHGLEAHGVGAACPLTSPGSAPVPVGRRYGQARTGTSRG